MLKGRVGRLYWGRCLGAEHGGHGFFKDDLMIGACWFGRFIEWWR